MARGIRQAEEEEEEEYEIAFQFAILRDAHTCRTFFRQKRSAIGVPCRNEIYQNPDSK